MNRSTFQRSSPLWLRSNAPKSAWDQSTIVAILKGLTVFILFLIVAVALQTTDGLRFVGAAFLFLFLLLCVWKTPRWGIILTFIFLVLLGGIRRWLIPDFGWPAYDPLILIAPLITLVCFLQMVIVGNVPSDTPLSRCSNYFLIIMALEVVNPQQGSLTIGLGGALYYIIPFLWFYVGRRFGDSNTTSFLFKTAVIVFTLTSIYGLKQNFFGLSTGEKSWIEIGGYAALHVSNEAIRVFSTFASQQEYAIALACGISICTSFVFHRQWQFILPVIILCPALILAGTRGPVVVALFSICVQWALMGKNKSVWLPRIALALVLGIAGIGWSLNNINTTSLSESQSQLVRHQQEGLLDPTKSTAPEHFLMVFRAVGYSITHPFGAGLGATTLAAMKLGGEALGAETDHGNLFYSLGFGGGALYLIISFLVLKQTVLLWNDTRNIFFLILLGFLICNFGQWLNGALYSLSFLTWFCVGTMDREFAALKRVAPVQRKELRNGKRLRIGKRQGITEGFRGRLVTRRVPMRVR